MRPAKSGTIEPKSLPVGASGGFVVGLRPKLPVFERLDAKRLTLQ